MMAKIIIALILSIMTAVFGVLDLTGVLPPVFWIVTLCLNVVVIAAIVYTLIVMAKVFKADWQAYKEIRKIKG